MKAGCANWAVVSMVAALVSGCSFWGDDGEARCALKEEYQASLESPRISVPAGLDAPDPAARLFIPEGPVPGEPLEKSAGCLVEPPDYFDRPIGESATPASSN